MKECNFIYIYFELLLSYSDRNFELNGRIRGLTAFNWACYKGHYDVIQLLKQNSEAKNINVDWMDWKNIRTKNLQTVFEKKKKINDWFALLLNF